MKRIVSLIYVLSMYVSCLAQVNCLSLSKSKTTSLVFPFAVTHVDRGANPILVQQVKEAPNVLMVKAGASDFPETNLSVVTSDGSVYQFDVVYNEMYPSLTVYVTPSMVSSIEDIARSIADNPPALKGMRDKKWDMTMEVTGIYIKDNVLFFQLSLRNNSPIDYRTELLQFYIRDKKQSKRTAVQEVPLVPLRIYGTTKIIKAYGRNVIVVALDQFTIPDAKLFLIQLLEKNGGRHLELKLRNKDLLKAALLPDMH